jgi:hypothetical protein
MKMKVSIQVEINPLNAEFCGEYGTERCHYCDGFPDATCMLFGKELDGSENGLPREQRHRTRALRLPECIALDKGGQP